MNKTRDLVNLMMLAALAVVINIFESLFIPPIQFGIRFGLANIMALIALKLYGVKAMVIVNAFRLVIGNLLKGMIFGSPFWISASGIFFSSIALWICSHFKSSLLFTAIMSAIMHSFGQLLMVVFFYQQVGIMSLLPVLVITSIATGCLTGIIASESLKRIKI